MDPEVTDNADQSRFEISVGGELAGHADYHRRPGLIAFVHTEIDDDFAGRGLGGELVSAALDRVREEGLEVLPFCPFVKGYIAKHPEYTDLVPSEHRGRFGLGQDNRTPEET